MDMLLSTPAASVGAPDLSRTQNVVWNVTSPHVMTQKRGGEAPRMRDS